MRKGFLASVRRYERCQPGASRTEVGLRQFHGLESRGEHPEIPDVYFQRLLDGKRWWEWTLNEYAGLYSTPEWPGWERLREDFADDLPAVRQIRQRVAANA